MAGSNQEWGLTEYFMARAFAPEAPGVYSSVCAPPQDSQVDPREVSKPSFNTTLSTPSRKIPSHWVVGASDGKIEILGAAVIGDLVGVRVGGSVGGKVWKMKSVEST